MKNKKSTLIVTLTLLLMVCGVSSLEARHHKKQVGVSFFAGQPVVQQTYIVQRQPQVQRVYVYPSCPHCTEVVVVQEPVYQRVYVQQPVIRRAFSFNWNFWH